MKKAIFFILSLLCSAVSFSQDYYISNDNDTIKGVVTNYKAWSKSPGTVVFKIDGAAGTIDLTPSNCKGFVVANYDHYISYHGTRIANSDNANIRTAGVTDELAQKDSINAFLREIYGYKGYVLYKYLDKTRPNFYLENAGVLKELEYYEYINDANVIISNNDYKRYIIEQLGKGNIWVSPPQLDKLAYKEDDLIDFFASVLQDQQRSTENKRNKYPMEILVGAGVERVPASIENDAQSIGSFYKDASVSPVFEFGLRIYNQRNFGRLFFQPALRFSSFKHSFILTTDDEYQTKATILSIHLAAGYFFKKSSTFSFYGSAGLGMTTLFNYTTNFISTNPVVSKEKEASFNKLTIHPELGFVLGRKLNIGVTATLPFKLPILTNVTYVYTISEAGIVLRYTFGKKSK